MLCGANNLGLGAPWWDVIFFYGHGQLSNEWYENLLSVCSVAELKNDTQTPQCAALVNQMYNIVGGFFEYNLYGEDVFLVLLLLFFCLIELWLFFFFRLLPGQSVQEEAHKSYLRFPWSWLSVPWRCHDAVDQFASGQKGSARASQLVFLQC